MKKPGNASTAQERSSSRPDRTEREAERERRSEFTHRAIIVIGLALLAAIVVGVVIVAADVLLVLFGGILFAIFLRGLADLLSHHTRVGPKSALTIVLLVLALAAGAGGWFLASEISTQLSQLGASLNDVWMQLREHLQREVWGRQLLALLWKAQSASTAGEDVVSRAAQIFSTTLGAVANLFIIVFIGTYLAANPAWYRRGLLRLVRPAERARAQAILDVIGHSLRWWLMGRAVGMALVGVITTAGLWLLGVPLALALGAIAAILDFVPFAGPIVAAVPAVLVAFSSGPTQAAYVALLYLGIQLLEGYVLTPLIEQRSVRLLPALTISAQVLLGVLTGALGVVLATPLTVVLVVLIKRLYVEDTLEHPSHRAE